ncbi:bestrophin family protein, partial [Burkholderia sp. GbtcB21]|uniref:bestrophin family protein n=1 Tax=Burkholderia sp. GbtcB21 TaxID=2824766 RepID=UPI001C2F5DCC
TVTAQLTRSLPDSGGDAERNRLAVLLIAFPYALKHQLRHTDPTEVLQRILGAGRAGALAPTCFKPAADLDGLRGGIGRALG